MLRRVARSGLAASIRARLPGDFGLVWYGQHEADWVGYFDLHQRVLGTAFDPRDRQQLALWATLARSCGWWWPREGLCVLAERPCAIRTEPVPGSIGGEVRPHDRDRPAVAFPDGWAVHAWHGTPVPAWVIEAPTAERIATERNVEIRRCALEQLSWPAYGGRADLTHVAEAADPGNPGHVLRLCDGPFGRILLAVNGSAERDGTRRWYGLRVPPWLDDPVEAAAWAYGLTGDRYAQLN